MGPFLVLINCCYLFHSQWHCVPLRLCGFLELTLLFVQESLAFMFEVTNLHEDSLREYDELELCYSESGFSSTLIWGSYVALSFELHL